MNINFQYIYDYFVAYKIVSIGLLIVLAFFLWKRPKIFAKSAFFVAVAILLFWFLQILNAEMFSGFVHKKEITTEKRMVDE